MVCGLLLQNPLLVAQRTRPHLAATPRRRFVFEFYFYSYFDQTVSVA